MKTYETSVGIVLFRKEKEFEYLILKSKADNDWGFPKGHINPGETELEAANREVLEETSITHFKLIENKKESYTYKSPKGSDRKVVLFLGLTNKEPTLSDEHVEYCWAKIDRAKTLLVHKEKIFVLEKFDLWLHKNPHPKP